MPLIAIECALHRDGALATVAADRPELVIKCLPNGPELVIKGDRPELVIKCLPNGLTAPLTHVSPMSRRRSSRCSRYSMSRGCMHVLTTARTLPSPQMLAVLDEQGLLSFTFDEEGLLDAGAEIVREVRLTNRSRLCS